MVSLRMRRSDSILNMCLRLLEKTLTDPLKANQMIDRRITYLLEPILPSPIRLFLKSIWKKQVSSGLSHLMAIPNS